VPLIHEVNDRTVQFSHTAEQASCPNLIKKQISAIHQLETQGAPENSLMRDGQVSLTFSSFHKL